MGVFFNCYDGLLIRSSNIGPKSILANFFQKNDEEFCSSLSDCPKGSKFLSIEVCDRDFISKFDNILPEKSHFWGWFVHLPKVNVYKFPFSPYAPTGLLKSS